MRRRLTVLAGCVVLLLALCAADLPSFAHPEPPAGQVELRDGWRLQSAAEVGADGAALSRPGYDDTRWHPVAAMPSTVLQALTDDGTYPELYYGTNLRDRVPPDLWRQDWWYRTTFDAPAGHGLYTLDFAGINYRAEVWLNGRRVADATQVVGMHVSHELDVTPYLRPGSPNVLAVRVIPERSLPGVDGVELADSWWDWINWNDLGYQGPGRNPVRGTSFVADRNAGFWKPVTLRHTGAVRVGVGAVTTELPLPATDRARLTVRTTVRNTSAVAVRGMVRATISRPGRPTVTVEQPVTLPARAQQEVTFDAAAHPELDIADPDLWWPYTLGEPNLYDLRISFSRAGFDLDTATSRFGVRTVTAHRDDDRSFPEQGRGGNFFLRVNGRDMLVRGAAYAPDLLYRADRARETAILRYVKDLGLNFVRFEGKFPDEQLVTDADALGIPLMFGWMCCNQWELWPQWDGEDRRVAEASLRSVIGMLRSHPSVFLWASGSDGHPPADVAALYHRVLDELAWPNPTVDTVSSFARDAEGQPVWDGIRMAGPYSWRPPSYWFSGRYPATRGATAEQGDNEHIPPFASLRRFIPPDKLWPINDTWSFHAGADPGNAALGSIRRAVDRRYGVSRGAAEFAAKAQLAHYESTRAQFEAFAAGGFDTHTMTVYWMLNNHWPSFFGHLFDYYLRPGGAYFGAKQGLRPLSVVFDAYATGDRSTAAVSVVNQSPTPQRGLRARVRVYDLSGRVREDRWSAPVDVDAGAAMPALRLPRVARDSRVFFVRCELVGADGAVLAENVYWQSQLPDDLGDPRNDAAFDLRQRSWADMTPLNTMAPVTLEVRARRDGERVVTALHNPTRRIAFFTRVEAIAAPDSDETLPTEYSDNYVTVFPGETVEVTATTSGPVGWVRATDYNGEAVTAPVE
ncbi:glycoside hydrolase [Mycobacterium sp. MYCO198283]|uniref:glycoside hydrolase family 2 protein n=1 Tax=Mycobacterium sp. MYCO198283 TaxID=2883505 RepID=UPI001E283483|nr:sugar-binding domain-containing protein [Mycobacterium sp. MYCO198283]MCG5433262.1 glycoside hydrolase [Mycobacterium sp. MYCO198283]